MAKTAVEQLQRQREERERIRVLIELAEKGARQLRREHHLP